LDLQRLAAVFPDQRGWIQKLAGDTGAKNSSELFSSLGYTGPVELFTMYACSFGSFPLGSLDYLEKHIDDLAKSRSAYFTKNGREPHPIELLKHDLLARRRAGCRRAGSNL
jgi:hypothetical protein